MTIVKRSRLANPRIGLAIAAALIGVAGAPAAATVVLDNAQPAESEKATPTRGQAQQLTNAGKFKEAAEAWGAIAEANPNDGQAWFMYAYTTHGAGDLDKAIELHLKAAEFEQARPTAIYNLGCAYALQGKIDDAFDALSKAVALGVTDTSQYRGDSDLKSLHDDERWDKLLKSMKKVADSPPQTALHFWAGEWDCYSSKTKQLSGRNTLELRVGGNVVHESWASEGQTFAGESWNYFNPKTGKWRQIWVDTSGVSLEMEADPTSEHKGLMFEGHQISAAGGSTLVRMHVRPGENGTVRQTGHQSDDDGATWTQRYDLVYVAKGTPLEMDEDEGDI